jgi:hypothetical protein|tara:strand:+ start:2930 stop:3154 length:225 start_codon:yes stop_codon:yes gene_type:complete
MSTFRIKYTEVQERQWIINVESKSLKEAEDKFTDTNEDPWGMVDSKKATWAWDSNEEGEAIDTLETNWEVEETD